MTRWRTGDKFTIKPLSTVWTVIEPRGSFLIASSRGHERSYVPLNENVMPVETHVPVGSAVWNHGLKEMATVFSQPERGLLKVLLTDELQKFFREEKYSTELWLVSDITVSSYGTGKIRKPNHYGRKRTRL